MCLRFRGRQRGRRFESCSGCGQSYSSTRKEGIYVLRVLVWEWPHGGVFTYGRVRERSSSLLRFFHMASSGEIPGIVYGVRSTGE